MAIGDGRVVSNFIVQALRGEDITIYGDGSQTRSFCYYEDNLDGMMALMASDYHEPVNIGNPGEFTIRELAETVIRMTNSSSSIIYLPLPQDDPKQRRPNITRAKTLLNWEPTVILANGLVDTIDYFRKIV
jgi:UDP-glucuronate decarboxylase